MDKLFVNEDFRDDLEAFATALLDEAGYASNGSFKFETRGEDVLDQEDVVFFSELEEE